MRRLSHDQWDAEFTRLYTTSHDFLFSLARGMPGRSGVTVDMLVCFFHCTRGCGRIARLAFPAPSDLGERDIDGKNSDASRREIAESHVNLRPRHCEEQSDEAIILRHSGMVRQHQTSDAQLRIGESRDSGFDASHRPGMTRSGLLRGACHRARIRATRWLS